MRKPALKNSKFAIVILAIMGLAFTAVGGGFTYFSYDFSQNALSASGIVLEVERHTSDNSTSYKPTIAYVDSKGDKHTGQTFLSSSSYNFRLGSRVDILYDTRHPESLRMDSWFALWGFGLIFLAAGLMLDLIMLFVLRRRKKAMLTPEAAPPSSAPARPAKTYSYSSNNQEPARKIARTGDHKSTVRRNR